MQGVSITIKDEAMLRQLLPEHIEEYLRRKGWELSDLEPPLRNAKTGEIVLQHWQTPDRHFMIAVPHQQDYDDYPLRVSWVLNGIAAAEGHEDQLLLYREIMKLAYPIRPPRSRHAVDVVMEDIASMEQLGKLIDSLCERIQALKQAVETQK